MGSKHVTLPKIASSGGSGGLATDTLVREKYVRTTRFEIISSGTSGTVAKPTNSDIVLDDFGGTVDAVIAEVSGGKPLVTSAKTSADEVVATTFDTLGAWTLTGTPSSYPVAIIYRVRQKLEDFDSTATNIWGNSNVEFDDSSAAYETVSKNLKAWNYSFNYTSSVLTSIVYTDGFSVITKTFNYTSGTLTSVVLSGSTPSGIALTKTFNYTLDVLTSITYS